MEAPDVAPISDVEPHVLDALEPGEELLVSAHAAEGVIAVTDRRLMVAARERIALAVPFQSLRRIQLDIERGRPATLVIVPETSRDAPQVLSIPPARYAEAVEALVAIGRNFAELPPDDDAQSPSA
jgi:hypothetical protein